MILIALCSGAELIFVLFASDAHFHIFIYVRLSGHLLGNSCSLGLRYVLILLVLDIHLILFHLGFWSRNFLLIVPFLDHCLLSFLCFILCFQ